MTNTFLTFYHICIHINNYIILQFEISNISNFGLNEIAYDYNIIP